jgi:hypothetical protein
MYAAIAANIDKRDQEVWKRERYYESIIINCCLELCINIYSNYDYHTIVCY